MWVTMPKKSDPDLRIVPSEYSLCRTWGHTWNFTYLDRVKGEGYNQGMKCIRCKTEKVVLVRQATGFRTGRGYKYPEQLYEDVAPYQMPKNSGGALTPEERGQCALDDIESRYKATVDEIATQRAKRRG